MKFLRIVLLPILMILVTYIQPKVTIILGPKKIELQHINAFLPLYREAKAVPYRLSGSDETKRAN